MTSALQAEVYEAFRSSDVPDGKALKAVIALSSALAKVEDREGVHGRDPDIDATSRDVGGINLRMVAMTVEMNLIKWMPGTSLAMVVTILFRVFSH